MPEPRFTPPPGHKYGFFDRLHWVLFDRRFKDHAGRHADITITRRAAWMLLLAHHLDWAVVQNMCGCRRYFWWPRRGQLFMCWDHALAKKRKHARKNPPTRRG